MRSLRFRLRTLIIAIAVLAPLLAAGAWCLQLGNSLDEMYGPDGLLESRRRFDEEVSDGSSALQAGRYQEAENHFRLALELFRSPSGRKHMHDPVGEEAIPSLGQADALAGQGRYREAEPLYARALASYLQSRGGLDEAKILDHHAATFRKMGRMTQAKELDSRTKKIRERSVQESEK